MWTGTSIGLPGMSLRRFRSVFPRYQKVSFNQTQQLLIEMRVLSLDYHIDGGHQISLFAGSRENKLEIKIYTLNQQDEESQEINLVQTYQYGDHADQYKSLHLKKRSNNMFIIALMTKQGYCDFLINMEFKASSRELLAIKEQKDLAVFSKLCLGIEAIFFRTKSGSTRQILLDNFTDQIKVSYSEETPSFLLSIMKERFISQHNRNNLLVVEIFKDMKIINSVLMLSHGKILSLYDLSTKMWLHHICKSKVPLKGIKGNEDYYGKQENEIKSIHFMNINKNHVYDILVEHQGCYLMKLVYYSNQNFIKLQKQSFLFDNKLIQKLVMQGDYLRYRDHGESEISIFFQVTDQHRRNKSDIYISNNESKIVQIVNDIDQRIRLVKVVNCPTTLLALCDQEQQTLLIYDFSGVNFVLEESELEERLVQKIQDFNYRENQTYYMDNNSIYYQQRGNLVAINLLTANQQMFDFGGIISELLVIEGRSVYYKCKNQYSYFVDLDWIFPNDVNEMKQNQKVTGFSDVLLKTPFLKCESLLMAKFEYDILSSKIATFSTPLTLKVFTPLNYNKFECVGTHQFAQNYLAYNVINRGPSQYSQLIAALDHNQNQIKTWNLGTGKVKKSVPIIGQKFKDFKLHSEWEGYSLVYKVIQSQKDKTLCKWKKIQVREDDIDVAVTYEFPLSPGSTIYVGSDNQLMLEFRANDQNVYSIHQSGNTKLICNINLYYVTIKAPVYFSPDFRTFIDYNYQARDLHVFQLPPASGSKNIAQNTPKVATEAFIPDLKQIVCKSKKNQPLIYLESNDRLTYLDKCQVQQSLPLFEDTSTNKKLIYEQFFDQDALERRIQVDIQNNSQNFLASLGYEEAFQYKVDSFKATLINKGRMERFAPNTDCYVLNNIRVVSSFTFYHWRVIELLETGELDIESINPEILEELLNVILPSGDQMVDRLIQTNVFQFERLLQLVQQLKKERRAKLKIHCLPNNKGITPLHVCIKNSYSKAAERMLDEIGDYPFDDHIWFIRDTFAHLITLCPFAFGDYLDKRVIQPSWAISYSEGELIKPDEECSFGLAPMQLKFSNPKEINPLLFDVDDDQDVRMPLSMEVADIPSLHYYNDDVSMKFLSQLAVTEDIDTLYSRVYIQAMLEIKWPMIRSAIIKFQLLPYLCYLFFFTMLSTYFFEMIDEGQIGMQMMYYSLQGVVVLLTLYFLSNEAIQLKNAQDKVQFFLSIWNYIDIVPLVLVICSIIVSDLARDQSITYSLNAISSFFLWLKLMYFFRISRKTGHLVKMIVEVVYDIRFFLSLLFFAMLAFSGSFYILSKSNPEADQFVPSMLSSNLMIYLLMLGEFDVENFGTTNVFLVWILFIFASMFLIVVMLNLLIAIISDTFERVQGSQKQRMYQEFAQMIAENTYLLTHDKKDQFDKQGNYLYIVSIETGESDQMGEAWEGKLNAMKNMISSRHDQLYTMLDDQQFALSAQKKDVQKKLTKLRYSTDKKIGDLSAHVTDMDKKMDSVLNKLKDLTDSQVSIVRLLKSGSQDGKKR